MVPVIESVGRRYQQVESQKNDWVLIVLPCVTVFDSSSFYLHLSLQVGETIDKKR